MFALAYNSEAAVPFDEPALEELARRAQERNRDADITGYLYFRDGQFLQYLEGPEQAVRLIMRRIERDTRHRVTNSYELGEIGDRLFPTWAMRYLGRDLATEPGKHVEDELRTLIVHASDDAEPPATMAPAVLFVTRRIASLDW